MFYPSNLRILSILASLTTLTTLTTAQISNEFIYRIRSGLDGTVLTAQYPTFAADLTLNLGKVTTEDWYRGMNQLWMAYNRTGKSQDVYWLKPRAGVLNELTGVPRDRENAFRITEIVKNSGSFLVRNLKDNLCLENQGVGLDITFEPCNEFNTAQQWDFEDPDNLRVKLRLFANQLFNILGASVPQSVELDLH